MKRMKRFKRVSGGAMVALIAVVAAIAIAACGGSSNASTTTKTTSTTAAKPSTTAAKGSAAETAFRTCLSQHGVKLPTGGFRGRTRTGTTGGGTPPAGGGYPGGGGGGGGFAGGGGGFAGGGAGGSSKAATAFKDCASKLPKGSVAGGGHFTPGAGGTFKRPTVSKATLTSFVACVRKNGYPSMPEPTTSGTTTNGFFPKSVESNKDFQKAAVKCESILTKGFKRPTGTGTTTTASS